MKAAVLCPGPSLGACKLRAGFDLVIGVNRAVNFAACGYWSLSDGARVFNDSRPIGMPVLITSRSMHTDMARTAPESRNHDYLDLYDIATRYPFKPIDWALFSTTTAIVASAYLGAKSIDVYGADMAGTLDFDGHHADHYQRDDDRWRREAGILGQVKAMLARDGISVQRIEAAHAHSA